LRGKSIVERLSLENGLRLCLAPLPHLSTATTALYVRAGARFETPRDAGLSHFVEHMLFRGTRLHPTPHSLAFAIEALGTTLEATTHADFTELALRTAPEDVPLAIALLGEIATEPLLDGLDIEKQVVREEILEGLDEEGNDIDVDDVMRTLMFGRHGLGHKIEGTLETVSAFRKSDIERQLARTYVGRNAALSVAGAFDVRKARRAAAGAFASMRKGKRMRTASPVLDPKRERLAVVWDDGSQCDMRVSFFAPGEADPRATALHLLVRVLDDGMSARVQRRLVEERGLAYHAFATLEPFEELGVIDFGAAVTQMKAPDVLASFLEIALELREGLVPERELDKAKDRAIFSLTTMRDDPRSVASFHGLQALLGMNGTPESHARRYAQTTPAEVREVARQAFVPENLHVACVGPLDARVVRRIQKTISAYR
jgi:predicted Zn-dependent peptidase